MKLPKILHLVLFIFVFIFILVEITNISTTYATNNALTGWAWSSNIGWISFNSSNAGAGGGPYNVYVDDSGNFGGWAWSSNIGWIKFGGLSGFPGSETNAHVNISTGEVTGWARACASTVSGDCTGASNADGWDGWIELSGTNHSKGDVTGNGGVYYDKDTHKFKGYAWGSDVVGWVNFDPNSPNNTANPPVPPVEYPGGRSAITGTCTIPSSATIPQGDITVTINPTVTNLQGGTAQYTYSPFTLSAGSYYDLPLIVTDSSNPVKQSIISCGSIIVTAPATDPAGPLLWFSNSRPQSNDINVWNDQTKTVREGQNVIVEYDTDSLQCSVYFIDRPVQYLKAQDWLDTSITGTGSFTFTNLVKGIYNVKLSCSQPIGMNQSSWLANIISTISSIFAEATTYSNTIEIIVTKTSIEEI